MARTHVGRHRAPGFSPLNEIADIASKTASPAVKVSAVAVASGGLLASFALPASAAPSAEGSPVAAGAVSTAPQIASQTVAVAAPAVETSAAPSFGVVGFTATAAAQQAPAALEITMIEAPAPAAAPEATPARASRTTLRTTPVAATPTVAAAPKAAPATAAPAAPAPTGGILGIAAGLTGIPYVWGGTTTSGFDCSGFTGYVYARAGISIPRTAEAQRAASTKVSNPAPGDLVFFGIPAFHVAIYAGNGQIYEASKPGRPTGLHTIWSTNVTYGRF